MATYIDIVFFKMTRLLLVFGIFCLSNCSTNSEEKEKSSVGKSLTIAVAANMQFAMNKLVAAFETKTGTECSLIIGSSGKLTAQIIQGAPFDVFVSANMKYPDEIHKNGLAAVTPKVYAYGQLVLWSANAKQNLSYESMESDSINHIAIANPKVAPYGMAAEQVLKQLKLLPKLREKLVFGESIAQTNQFITTQSAELGFTAMSVVLSSDLKKVGRWIPIDPSLHKPIEQGVVVMKQNQATQVEKALTFYDFLSTPEAKSILEKFGYSVNL